MSRTDDTIKSLWPNLTPKQAATLRAELVEFIDTFAEDTAKMFAEGFVEKRPELIRTAPSASMLQRHMEAAYKAQHEVDFVPAGEKINIGRFIGELDADARLEALPYAAAQKLAADDAASEVAKLDARKGAPIDEAADDEFLRRMGEDPYQILPSRRRMLLAARDVQPEAKRRAALTVDELTLKCGGDASKLSAMDRMTMHRASAALK